MPSSDPYGFLAAGETLLEVEVAGRRIRYFEQRYLSATGVQVTPGKPKEYQFQPNKWGTECRVYFKSSQLAATLTGMGFHVEGPRPYHRDYSYRINDSELWWELVEDCDFRLGVN